MGKGGRKTGEKICITPRLARATRNQREAGKNKEPLRGAGERKIIAKRGKHLTGVKRWKACNRCQAREEMHSTPSAGKHINGVKRGKTCNERKARENTQPVSSV